MGKINVVIVVNFGIGKFSVYRPALAQTTAVYQVLEQTTPVYLPDPESVTEESCLRSCGSGGGIWRKTMNLPTSVLCKFA